MWTTVSTKRVFLNQKFIFKLIIIISPSNNDTKILSRKFLQRNILLRTVIESLNVYHVLESPYIIKLDKFKN